MAVPPSSICVTEHVLLSIYITRTAAHRCTRTSKYLLRDRLNYLSPSLLARPLSVRRRCPCFSDICRDRSVRSNDRTHRINSSRSSLVSRLSNLDRVKDYPRVFQRNQYNQLPCISFSPELRYRPRREDDPFVDRRTIESSAPRFLDLKKVAVVLCRWYARRDQHDPIRCFN